MILLLLIIIIAIVIVLSTLHFSIPELSNHTTH